MKICTNMKNEVSTWFHLAYTAVGYAISLHDISKALSPEKIKNEAVGTNSFINLRYIIEFSI